MPSFLSAHHHSLCQWTAFDVQLSAAAVVVATGGADEAAVADGAPKIVAAGGANAFPTSVIVGPPLASVGSDFTTTSSLLHDPGGNGVLDGFLSVALVTASDPATSAACAPEYIAPRAHEDVE